MCLCSWLSVGLCRFAGAEYIPDIDHKISSGNVEYHICTGRAFVVFRRSRTAAHVVQLFADPGEPSAQCIVAPSFGWGVYPLAHPCRVHDAPREVLLLQDHAQLAGWHEAPATTTLLVLPSMAMQPQTASAYDAVAVACYMTCCGGGGSCLLCRRLRIERAPEPNDIFYENMEYTSREQKKVPHTCTHAHMHTCTDDSHSRMHTSTTADGGRIG